MTTGQAHEPILVLDTRNQEHYLNWANVVEVRFHLDGERLKATIVTTAPAVGRDGDRRLHEIVTTDGPAEALRVELRRRLHLPAEDAPAPPSLRLPQPQPQVMSFQRH